MSHHKLENIDFNKYFYTPRTLFTMCFMVGLVYFATFGGCEYLRDKYKPYYYDKDYPDVFEDYRFPILIMCITIIGFASTQFPDSLIKRPHPVFWRILLGIFLCYSCFITVVVMLPAEKARNLFKIFLCYSCFITVVVMLPAEKARNLFKIFHPAFGVDLPERNYADDCRLYTPEFPEKFYIQPLYDNIFDVHFVAHFGGWWFKMMIIRDVKIAWLTSITFEFIEISFRHMLPNFWECWWDQLLLDVFGCNMIGIILGSYTMKYAGVSRLNWIYKKPTGKPDRSAIANAAAKFRPDVLSTYEWQMFSSLKRYCLILFYMSFILSVDSLNFFMKYVLWIPAESDILKARVAIWAFTAIITSKEFFEYVDDPNCKRVGPFFWLSSYTVAIEYFVWFKFSRGYIVMIPFPTGVKIIHAVYIVVILAGAVYSYQNGQFENEANKKKTYNLIDPELTIDDTQKVLKESKSSKKTD